MPKIVIGPYLPLTEGNSSVFANSFIIKSGNMPILAIWIYRMAYRFVGAIPCGRPEKKRWVAATDPGVPGEVDGGDQIFRSNMLNQLTLENNLLTGNLTARSVSIRRCHGLGNVICLLPALDYLHSVGCEVQVITNPSWIHAFSRLRPDYRWISEISDVDNDIINLDDMTKRTRPTEHRIDEFAHLLNIEAPLPSPQLTIPPLWREPFEPLTGSIVLAPEGGHPSRSWPREKAAQLKAVLPNQKLVLVGTNPEPDIPCDFDTRGQLELHELFGLLAVADAVITMDSGVLHITAALQVPTVAVFGGMNPEYRVRPDQRIVVLQTNLPCCPCSKNETCFDRFDCIQAATPQDVSHAIQRARQTDRCVILKIPSLVQGMLNPLLPGIRLPRK